jgi:hypothetical protein
MVSCTGSQFCGFALSETKNRAVSLMEGLEKELNIPKSIRVHFTGCPNSCGQAQVTDGSITPLLHLPVSQFVHLCFVARTALTAEPYSPCISVIKHTQLGACMVHSLVLISIVYVYVRRRWVTLV